MLAAESRKQINGIRELKFKRYLRCGTLNSYLGGTLKSQLSEVHCRTLKEKVHPAERLIESVKKTEWVHTKRNHQG